MDQQIHKRGQKRHRSRRPLRGPRTPRGEDFDRKNELADARSSGEVFTQSLASPLHDRRRSSAIREGDGVQLLEGGQGGSSKDLLENKEVYHRVDLKITLD